MERSRWKGLIVENRATPRRIADASFREWMTEQRIFVSSVMDEEMRPARQAVRERIERLGGHPEMWEVLAPRDQHPEWAYLEGVSRSNLFLLLLGHSYGVSDETGYSPTEKENNHAKDLGIYRMLFQPDGIVRANRDGKLNRLVGSLYNEVSGGTYASPDDLANQVERQLRDIASAQESYWIKLGNVVFPGSVSLHSSSGQTTFTVRARVRQHAVRQSFAQLAQRPPRDLVLTWSANSYAVQIEDVVVESGSASEEEVTITCRPTNRHGSHNPWGQMGVTIQSGGRSITPADQAQMWARRAVLGQPAERTGDLLLDRFNTPAEQTLPEVLHGLRAQGWFAEGVARLYVVEELKGQFGATFERISVGPATATGVRVEFRFVLPGYQPTPILMEGVVLLP